MSAFTIWVLFADMASADQQQAAGTQEEKEDKDHNSEDVAMETEEQEGLQASELQELKPKPLNSTKASEKGFKYLDFGCFWLRASDFF